MAQNNNVWYNNHIFGRNKRNLGGKYMEEKEKEQMMALLRATVDDFRGFLVDGEEIPVADDDLHALVALKELEKYPGWKYEHGVGRDPITELLYLKKAIYMTRIKVGEGKYQRSIAYCKDVNQQEVQYRGEKTTLAEAIKSIALGSGYEVDEYEVEQVNEEENKYKFKKPTNYTAKIEYKQREGKRFHKSFQEGDQPIFAGDKYIGFIHNGKFYSADPSIYKRGSKGNGGAR